MRRLAVDLPTTRNVTNVLLSLCGVPSCGSELTVRTTTPSASPSPCYLIRQRCSVVWAGEMITRAWVCMITHGRDVACRCNRQTRRNCAGDRAAYNSFIWLNTPPVKASNVAAFGLKRRRAAQRQGTTSCRARTSVYRSHARGNGSMRRTPVRHGEILMDMALRGGRQIKFLKRREMRFGWRC